MTTLTVPTAPVVGVQQSRRARTVTVACPYGSHTHVHGWPPGDTTGPGLRVAHCGVERSYFIPTPGGGAP